MCTLQQGCTLRVRKGYQRNVSVEHFGEQVLHKTWPDPHAEGCCFISEPPGNFTSFFDWAFIRKTAQVKGKSLFGGKDFFRCFLPQAPVIQHCSQPLPPQNPHG